VDIYNSLPGEERRIIPRARKKGQRVKRILIIDDERRIGQLYTMLLSEEGFEAKYASSAREATGLLIRESFDLVLLDINIPEIGGEVIYEVIREYDRHMKVIVSSVHPVEEQIRSVLGASAYHDKAQGVDMLVAKIKEVLDDEDVKEVSL
jgi:DNA-binding NtrC family response regulator